MSSSVLKVDLIRKDFPILEKKIHGKLLTYLDNAATTQKPLSVLEAIERYYRETNANVHRGIHTLAEEATALYEDTRELTAKFLNAPSSSGIVFTRNATESINLVAYSWGHDHVQPGDEILITAMEHHSNLVPWQVLAKERGAKLVVAGLDAQGRLDMTDLEKKLTSRTKIVAVTHVSNVLGTINPIRKIVDLAHRQGALVLVDGAQSAPHMKVDVQALDCDFFVLSSHKMLGPMGVGVLYAKPEILDSMKPFLLGGEMIAEVRWEETTWNDIPWKFEAGTPNVGGVAAFGEAIRYLEKLGLDNVRAHEEKLTAYALKVLKEVPGIILYGPPNASERGGVVAFNVGQIHPHDLGTLLDREGIAVRAGHHCAQPLMGVLNTSSTARASFYIYNTEEEIDRLAQALKSAQEFFNMPHRAARS